MPPLAKVINGLHQAAEWSVPVLIAMHVLAAYIFVYRDRLMSEDREDANEVGRLTQIANR